MADEPTVNASADVPAVSDSHVLHNAPVPLLRPDQSVAPVDAANAPHADNEAAASPTADSEAAGHAASAADATTNGDKAAEAGDAADPAAAESAAAPSSKDKKRKSTGGNVPEHKAKKLNKKKSMPTLHLECKPGEYYWARLKGYPPWPSIICDEAMLPESLLATRPVSTARPDGSIRDDFKEGGKNAKERTFPIMFLATNEFQWMINTNLTPLDPEECKTPSNTKMTKALQEAYSIAAEAHDIQHFKDILTYWQEEEEMFRKQEEEAQAEAERVAAEKAAKAEQDAKDEANKPKKKARKSKGGDGDVEMSGVATPKSSKKRKNEGEGDSTQPKKTPKVTKLNAPKTPGDEASASKKASKPKKKVVQAPTQEDEEAKPEMTEAEKQAQREKAVLYLRHRLQRGFLSRDQAPQDSEMQGMADFFTQLEAYEALEPALIRNTKIHKVLKAIMKLASVPRDDEFHFKKRSGDLLELWNKRMEADTDGAPASAVDAKTPEVNGDSKPAAPAEAKKETEEATEGAEAKAEHADEIEQKVEGKPDAVADALPPAAGAGGDADADAKAPEVPTADVVKPETAADATTATAAA